MLIGPEPVAGIWVAREFGTTEESFGCETTGAGRRQGVAADFFLSHDPQSVHLDSGSVSYPWLVEGLRRALRNPLGWIAFLLVEAIVLLAVVGLVPLSERRTALFGVAIAMVIGNYVLRRRFLAADR